MYKKKISKDGIEASSATYRKATNSIAEYLGVTPEHSKSPKHDFEKLLMGLDDKVAEIALNFYRMGLRRGLIKATDWVVDGKLKYKDGRLTGPDSFVITMNIKMPNQKTRKK